jgi:hypothetical protein
MYLDVFLQILPVISQDGPRLSSFGALGECAKSAYAPPRITRNAFFLTRN